MIDLNKFYAQYCADPEKTKFEMVQKAARELTLPHFGVATYN